MRRSYLAILACAALLLAPLAASAAPPKGRVDLGKNEYMERCSMCHGTDARGTGGVAELLKKPPTDLTVLAKGNGGVFPARYLQEVIDGRETVRAHGGSDMPIWGTVYRAEPVRAAEYYGDMQYDMDMFVRSRMAALMDYLYRIQAK